MRSTLGGKEVLVPQEVPRAVELHEECIVPADLAERSTTEIDTPVERPNDGDVSVSVDGHARRDAPLAITKSLAPEVLSRRVELRHEDIRGAWPQEASSEVSESLHVPDYDRVAGRIRGHVDRNLGTRVAEPLAPHVDKRRGRAGHRAGHQAGLCRSGHGHPAGRIERVDAKRDRTATVRRE
jgi:hypothetical protein